MNCPSFIVNGRSVEVHRPVSDKGGLGILRIWKLLCLAVVCCFVLGGCALPEKTGGETAEKAVQTKQTATAVPEKVPEQGVPVLMYHMIGDVKDNDAVLLESHFRQQMQFLKDNDYHPITLQQLYAYMVNKQPIPERPVVLTFDDGYPDTYTVVTPIMKEYGFACTVFIPTYDADQGTRLTWQQIKEMQAAGIQIASHCHHHDEMGEMTAEQLRSEIATSQQRLKEELGIDNAFFCYPYGSEDEAAEKELRRAGIKLAFTMKSGWAKYGDNPYAVRRVWIGNAVDIDNFRQRLTTERYASR